MALILSTNCGFVTVAPSTDPEELGVPCDGHGFAFRATSPAGNNIITEIGFWQGGSENDVAKYNAGIYANDAGEPGALIATQSTGQSTTNVPAWYKYTGLNIPISPATIYWIAFGMEPVSQSNWTDIVSEAGELYRFEALDSETLSDPFVVDGGPAMLISIYAKYELAPSVAPTGNINGPLVGPMGGPI